MTSTTPIPTPNPTSAAWAEYIWTQNFNVTNATGQSVTFSLSDFDMYLYYNALDVATWGLSLGLSSMLFIVLLLVTPSDRRRQPIFLLNALSLFILIFRAIIAIIVDCASYQGIGSYFFGDFSQYDNATWAPLFIYSALNPFLYAIIMCSLVLQVRVVFAAEPRTQTI